MSRTLFVILLVAASALSLAGCLDDSARAQKWAGSAATRSQVAGAQTLSPSREHPHSARAESHREALLSTYHNPDAGISFRYPKNYLLEQGDVKEYSFFLKTQEELDAEQPGAELVVTVLIPEDAYPNTTFEHGSLQLSVKEAEGPAACRANSEAGDAITPRQILTAEGIRFDVAEEESSVAGTTLRQRHYAAFSGGECYEFLAAVAADPSPDAEGFLKAADTGKILRQLEKIITTVKLSEMR